MTITRPRGQSPKPESKRRRANKPASYGAANPVTAGVAGEQPALGFKAHNMVIDLWNALENSVEGQFFSAADWERARLEMWFINQVLTSQVGLTASNWQRVQHGLSELLVSPADKRRAGIALQRAAVDVDEVAADEIIGEYRQVLKSV